ncbi:MAG TPA: amidohydrolase family protein, partial [Advenella sp.]|nr:amidohydrolase family protein [Advenella sp.]
CDCHIHVYDDRYPAVAGATLLPANATIEQYRDVQAVTGTTRAVLVTPSTYGSDNRSMLDGLRTMGDAARAVAVIDGSESDDELAALNAVGVRAIRLNLSLGVVGSINSIVPLAEKIQKFNWHIQVLMSPDLLARHHTVFQNLPVPVVFDHFARISPAQVYAHPAHDMVLKLLHDRKAWVKLSGGYIVSESRTTSDPALDRLARSFIDAASDQVVWGSDWPHATAQAGKQPMPDNEKQMQCLVQWARDEATLHRILVTNPETLYGFTNSSIKRQNETGRL